MVSAGDWVSSGSIERERIEPLRLEPPPYYIARPQIVDRVAYLQELLAQRTAAMQEQAAKVRQLSYETPLRFGQYAEEQERQRRLEQMNEIQRRVYTRERGQDFVGRALKTGYDIARTNIPEPIRKPIMGAVEAGISAQIPQPAKIAYQAAHRIPGFEKLTPERPEHEAAELLVPREVWDAALELVPGIGSVPDLMRAVRSGSPEAVRVVDRKSVV